MYFFSEASIVSVLIKHEIVWNMIFPVSQESSFSKPCHLRELSWKVRFKESIMYCMKKPYIRGIRQRVGSFRLYVSSCLKEYQDEIKTHPVPLHIGSSVMSLGVVIPRNLVLECCNKDHVLVVSFVWIAALNRSFFVVLYDIIDERKSTSGKENNMHTLKNGE